MCRVCRKKVSKKLLNRYVRKSEKAYETYATFGNMILDEENKLQGRGYYVCNNEECKEKFQKIKLKNKQG